MNTVGASKAIGVVTSARSDFGILLPVLHAIRSHPALRLRILATGMHLAREFGHTVDQIYAEGFSEVECVDAVPASDAPADIARAMAAGLSGFASIFESRPPQVLLVLGDRYDMLPAVVAALPFCIPVAHIAGGEATEGLIDEAIRHSVTKCSHLHFVTTSAYAGRVIQLGEEPWRVFITGSPALDNLRTLPIPDRAAICRRFSIDASRSFGVATFHPVTLEAEDTARYVGEWLAALGEVRIPWVFTFPNADTNGRQIIAAIERFVSEHPSSVVVQNAGQAGYFGLMRAAAVMSGNSSSGIIEAASFRLPVVNVGTRQQGRLRGRNVIDVPCERAAILHALERALDPAFRDSLRDLVNPYGDGYSAGRIVDQLAVQSLDRRLLVKRFHAVDVDVPTGA